VAITRDLRLLEDFHVNALDGERSREMTCGLGEKGWVAGVVTGQVLVAPIAPAVLEVRPNPHGAMF
jgi:hypothetical protein